MKVSLPDASAATGVPQRTLRRWCADGRLTTTRGPGAAWLVNPLEVDQLAEMREQRGGRLTRAS